MAAVRESRGEPCVLKIVGSTSPNAISSHPWARVSAALLGGNEVLSLFVVI